MTAKRKRDEAPRKQGGYLTQKEMQPTRPGKDKLPEPGDMPATTPDGAAATNPDDANEPRRGGGREL